MKGISEERLIAYKQSRKLDEHQSAFIDTMIDACEELNNWLPIDENTPKDRNFLGFIPGAYGWELVWWEHRNDRWSCHPYVMTHWQELPSIPNE